MCYRLVRIRATCRLIAFMHSLAAHAFGGTTNPNPGSSTSRFGHDTLCADERPQEPLLPLSVRLSGQYGGLVRDCYLVRPGLRPTAGGAEHLSGDSGPDPGSWTR